jgi:hypothetical protein
LHIYQASETGVSYYCHCFVVQYISPACIPTLFFFFVLFLFYFIFIFYSLAFTLHPWLFTTNYSSVWILICVVLMFGTHVCSYCFQ